MTAEPNPPSFWIPVAAAVGAGIVLSRILEPTLGAWGFLLAMGGAALVALGLSAVMTPRPPRGGGR